MNLAARQAALRLVVLVPPALLLVGAAALLVASPFAWGAGEHVGMPAWMPTFSGLVTSVPSLVNGASAFRGAWNRSRGRFAVSILQRTLPALALVVIALTEMTFASRIGASDTYDSVRDASGEITIGPALSLLAMLLGALFLNVFAAAGGYYLVESMTNESSRFAKQASEPDAMGEILGSGRP